MQYVITYVALVTYKLNKISCVWCFPESIFLYLYLILLDVTQ